jgi:hypothetical protein
MGFLLESPVQLADSQVPYLSTPRGALHEPFKAEPVDPSSERPPGSLSGFQDIEAPRARFGALGATTADISKIPLQLAEQLRNYA